MQFHLCLSGECKSLSQYKDCVIPVAFFANNPPKSITTPISYHPPELVVFKLGITDAVDFGIWDVYKPLFLVFTEASDRYINSLLLVVLFLKFSLKITLS